MALSTDKGQLIWGKMIHAGPTAQLYLTRL